MMKNVTESLAGRVAVLDLKGFSLKEIENEGQNPFIPTNDFIEKIDFLYGNPKKNIIICNNNKKKAKEFNVSHILEKIKKIYAGN